MIVLLRLKHVKQALRMAQMAQMADRFFSTARRLVECCRNGHRSDIGVLPFRRPCVGGFVKTGSGCTSSWCSTKYGKVR